MALLFQKVHCSLVRIDFSIYLLRLRLDVLLRSNYVHGFFGTRPRWSSAADGPTSRCCICFSLSMSVCWILMPLVHPKVVFSRQTQAICSATILKQWVVCVR